MWQNHVHVVPQPRQHRNVIFEHATRAVEIVAPMQDRQTSHSSMVAEIASQPRERRRTHTYYADGRPSRLQPPSVPTFTHFYPFAPGALDGGTLRLLTSVHGTQLLGSTRVLWWDAATADWVSVDPAEIGTGTTPHVRSEMESFKRRLFPSTLWESGSRASRKITPDTLLRNDIAVLHTTYLGPAVERLARGAGRRVVLDVYDSVWRAHKFDAQATSNLALSAARRGYSKTVRHRESRAVEAAWCVPVAGWSDSLLIRQLSPRSRWLPTGLSAEETPAPRNAPLRIGLIGSFAHSATVDAARILCEGALARSSDVEIVLAGLGSQEWAQGRRVTALGRVETTAEFYRSIDAVVVPVRNGTGMKCKLAEAALAGRPVITTPAGAEGFPPDIAANFVVGDINGITPEQVQTAVSRSLGANYRDAFAVTEMTQAAHGYAAFLSEGL